jgi:hypothetical protein
MNDLRITNNALGFAAVAGLASVCLQGAAYGEGSEFPDGSVSITSLPFSDTGDISDNSDDFDATCPYSGSTSPDVFYAMDGSLGEITITLCDTTAYDTKTYILDSAFNVFACNDDACGSDGFKSQLDANLVAGTYYLAVDGYNGAAGVYTMSVDGFVPPVPCDPFDCTGTDEGEACGEATNGGCNDGVPYVPVAEGEIVCGTIWADAGTRDTDWFGYNHAGGILEWTVEAEAPCVALIITPEAQCASAAVLFAGDSAGETCGTAFATGDLAADTYGLFAGVGGAGGAGIFEGYPCGGGFNNYSAFAGAGTPPPPPCDTDIDGNGATDFQDLVQILSNYGPCPE